jgi:hypothetical protein
MLGEVPRRGQHAAGEDVCLDEVGFVTMDVVELVGDDDGLDERSA